MVARAAAGCGGGLEEEAKDLATQMFAPGIQMVHDAARGGHHHVAELAGRQQVRRPLLDVCDGNVKPAKSSNYFKKGNAWK